MGWLLPRERTESFVNAVLRAFSTIRKEIDLDTVEHNFSPKLGRYLVEGVLGYETRDFAYERGRTDVTLFDENGFRIAVIETKRPRENLSAEKWREQAGKYADASTRFVGLANGFRFLLWEIVHGKRILRADIDFEALSNAKRLSEDKLTSQEVEQFLALEKLAKAEIWSESKYSRFNEFYAKIDLSEDAGFEKLIERLNYLSNDLLRQYAYNAFDDYLAGYLDYQRFRGEIGDLKKQTRSNAEMSSRVARASMEGREQFKKYAGFEGYFEWKEFSNRSDKTDEENKPVFCKESTYALLSRLLFIRICEDKGILKKKISNGGIEQLREFLWEELAGNEDSLFKEILQLTYRSANNIYEHFFEKGSPLDWYETGDGELNRALNVTLWTLNQFDFSKVDKDILGKMYEKYLPKDERKKLGEFYTPDEVVDYILDAVGYEPSKAIEDRDLIDPACGSGGFLVRATRRLIGRYAVKFGKATPKESVDMKKWRTVLERLTPEECRETLLGVATHIHGFDINPFAAHISEMNLLFQVVDLYQKARQGKSGFRIPRFQVYRTDSLRLPDGQTNLNTFHSPTGQSLGKNQTEIDALKNKKYDYIVGNPPYVSVQEIDANSRAVYSRDYATAKGNFDLYIPFIELGVNFLSVRGKFGYICSNQFFKRDYGRLLRQFMLEKTQVDQIVNFKDAGIFKDATNYPTILVLSKGEKKETEVVSVKKPDEHTLNQIVDGITNANIGRLFVNLRTFGRADWVFESPAEAKLARVFSGCKPLGELAEVISGTQTGSDKTYLGKLQKTEERYSVVSFKSGEAKIEAAQLIPFVLGRQVQRWKVDFGNRVSVFPYFRENETYRLPNEDEFKTRMPFLYSYLIKNRETLSKRLWYGQSAQQLHGTWFAYMYFKSDKPLSKLILTPALVIRPRFAPTNSETLFTLGTAGVFGVLPKKDYLSILGVLNSKLIHFFIKRAAPEKRGGYFQLNSRIISAIPIKVPETEGQKQLFEEIALLARNALKASEPKVLDEIENKIDSLVFDLYGLSEADRRLLEKAVA